MTPPDALVAREAPVAELVTAAPHPRLYPAVLGYRGFRLDLGAPRRRLELPVGAVTLLLGFEGPVTILRPHGTPDRGDTTDPGGTTGTTGTGGTPDPGALTLTSGVSGLSTGPVVGVHGGRLAGVEVQLAPWAAYTWFGIAQHELADRSAGPGALPRQAGRRVAELAARLARLPGWGERFRVLDATLGRWTEDGRPAAARTVGAWQELVRGGGTLPVPRLAAHVGWSVRQLEKRFRDEIGLRPKAAARVLRLQRARRMLAAGHPAARTAAHCGFYDQAHLSGEFRALTGCTPGGFEELRRLQSAGAAGRVGTDRTDRLAGEVTSVLLPPARPGRHRPAASVSPAGFGRSYE
ncbi:helix-turn-helix transcriptional regulator [Streptomyces sp. NPDC004111]|uniref:helix-turn-helix transcriptional regulator n=1 Tax=Streptomyces sp. NPDC004111 TaxID=3364690 RepID=UPI00367A34E1